MNATLTRPAAPSADKRWRLIDTTMRRHGYSPSALIEGLHSAQECFGFLDETALRYIAASLQVPPAKVYGAATFYHFFTLKPQGEHTCVVCTGTACYIKGASELLKSLDDQYHVKEGQTTPDNKLSVLTARCIGSCGLAPAVVLDGEILGRADAAAVHTKIESWMTP